MRSTSSGFQFKPAWVSITALSPCRVLKWKSNTTLKLVLIHRPQQLSCFQNHLAELQERPGRHCKQSLFVRIVFLVHLGLQTAFKGGWQRSIWSQDLTILRGEHATCTVCVCRGVTLNRGTQSSTGSTFTPTLKLWQWQWWYRLLPWHNSLIMCPSQSASFLWVTTEVSPLNWWLVLMYWLPLFPQLQVTLLGVLP